MLLALAASREMASGVNIEAVESTTMPDTFVQFVWQFVTDLHVFKTRKKLNNSDTIMYLKTVSLAVADHSPSSLQVCSNRNLDHKQAFHKCRMEDGDWIILAGSGTIRMH